MPTARQHQAPKFPGLWCWPEGKPAASALTCLWLYKGLARRIWGLIQMWASVLGLVIFAQVHCDRPVHDRLFRAATGTSLVLFVFGQSVLHALHPHKYSLVDLAFLFGFRHVGFVYFFSLAIQTGTRVVSVVPPFM
eukprot:gene7893-biopygen6660